MSEPLEEGQKVWAPKLDGTGELRAVFIAVATGEPITVNGIFHDAAWISWGEGDDEGTSARLPYFKLRARRES